jgi:hypothetical protein
MGLIGKEIKNIRNLTREELDAEGWDEESLVTAIILEDDTAIYASQDEEGNGPGELFGSDSDSGLFIVEQK